MKKLLALLLAIALVFSLTACFGAKDEEKKGNDEKTEKVEKEETESPEETEAPEETERPAKPAKPSKPSKDDETETEAVTDAPDENEPPKTDAKKEETASFVTDVEGLLMMVNVTHSDNVVSEIEIAVEIPVDEETAAMFEYLSDETILQLMMAGMSEAGEGAELFSLDFCSPSVNRDDGVIISFTFSDLDDEENVKKLMETAEDTEIFGVDLEMSDEPVIYFDDFEKGILDGGFSYADNADQDGEDEPSEPKEETDATESEVTPLLYKVTDDDGDVIWLFGSIHVGREGFYPLPEEVMDAYEGSDALAVEFDVLAFQEDMQAQTQLLLQVMYTDGTTIKDHISEDLYEKAVEILRENGLYSGMLDMYNVYMWSTFIDECTYQYVDNYKPDCGVDVHFLEKAKDDGKEIIDIESAELQYSILTGFSDEVMAYILEGSIAAYNDASAMEEELDMMLDLWASGDASDFEDYLESEVPASKNERELYEEVNNAIITERNITMTDFAEEALEDGEEVFIVVGAAHVIGEGAMADLLEERGYTVEIIVGQE